MMEVSNDRTDLQKEALETLGITRDRMIALYKIARHIRIDAETPIEAMIAILRTSRIPEELVFMAYIINTNVGV